MKKLNVLLIVAMLAAALLAANPPGKLVRLEVINGSGDTVYMRLQGRGTGAFYYLTIPAGWDKTFTVLVDSYKRTTWACGGIVSSGSLLMTGNVKLKFVACGSFPVRTYAVDINGDGDLLDSFIVGGVTFYEGIGQAPNYGEPTQEKVVYYLDYTNSFWRKYAALTYFNGVYWNSFSFWVHYKTTFAVWARTRFPRGMYMRYRY